MTRNAKHITKPSRIIAICMAIALAGCLTACSDDTLWGYDTPHPAVATPDPVAVRLADAAQKTSSALASLAAVEQARTPSPAPPVTPTPADDLNKPITVAWTGPAAPLAERLAVRCGYKFRQIGVTPTVPPTVTVDVVEKPILEIFRDIGLQMGSRANLVIDANRHVVELEYASVGK
jgi:defect-in-organelle-trafficking protein DotD